jgi:hypothetical protein
VNRHADERARRQKPARHRDGQRPAAQVHAVGPRRDSHVDAVVHEKERARARGGGAQPLGEREQRAARQVLLAELHRRKPGIEGRRDDVHEIAAGGRPPVGDEDQARRAHRRGSAGVSGSAR